MKEIKKEFFGLSTRAMNCLAGSGIYTKKQAENLTFDEMTKMQNLGKGTSAEIIKWLGRDPPKPSNSQIEKSIKFLERNGYKVTKI